MRHVSKAVPALVIVGVLAVVAMASRDPLRPGPAPLKGADPQDLRPVVSRVDELLSRRWAAAGVVPADAAPDLLVLRRLHLALLGAVPSLQEIRAFEADTRPDRLEHWVRRILADSRFHDYFAERLARSLVGREGGQFIVFRRDRFVGWLSEQLERDVAWDDVVRTMVAGTGLWTGKPEVNFITAAVNDGDVDENKLAGRTVRAFLGQRIDCAQCHDHPFDHWKQHEFEGLAAFYGQVKQTIVGIEDKTAQDGRPVVFEVEDRQTLQKRLVEPAVPFETATLPASGTRREQLAAWITSPENRRFERAIANRVWGLMFGRAYVDPVDDLPDPPAEPDLLDLIGSDFRTHRYSLHRLIQVIAATQAFQRDSRSALLTEESFARAEDEWAVFPLVRLRPEQVIGSIQQASSAQTVDENSLLLFRAIRFFEENDFIREYGDLGDNELQDRGGTIPQRLLMMNGELATKGGEAGPLTAAGRIAGLARDDATAIDVAYLVCLTRRPTPDEAAHFAAQLAGRQGDGRGQAIEDLFWSLLNSTEFSWNH